MQFGDGALVTPSSRNEASHFRRLSLHAELAKGTGDGVLEQGQSRFRLLPEPIDGTALQARQCDPGAVLGRRRAIDVASDDLDDGLLERRAGEERLGVTQAFQQGADAGGAHRAAHQLQLVDGGGAQQQLPTFDAMRLVGLTVQLIGLVDQVMQRAEGVDGLLGEHGIAFVVELH